MFEARVGLGKDTMTIMTSQSAAAADNPAGNTADSQSPRAGRAARRTFTTAFKRAIVAEYDAAPKGTKGAVLRRERLYDSHVNEWRQAIQAGTLETQKRGRPANSAQQTRIRQLENQVAKLEAENVKKDETIADREAALTVLGKGVAFLEALSSQNAT